MPKLWVKHEAATIWNFVALQVSDIVHANPWLSGRLRKGFDCDWAKLSFEQQVVARGETDWMVNHGES